ncbi:hypothetical protein BHE74_00023596 [Ensete ventricosum]|uniref:Uncharacterized protein n=1 Tax=Ensete ventricosum TaxID=4639 RepID=A0A427AJ34_ENSVE|nr:hypothetical protein B296_00006447 [Ensete ventricosum]RWW07473.1 hypothetical protein GW17_00029146 [Ensete ventricosum]RWW68846.1 hypothetical protein BHE74_00023596 [Ensete ventricosum]RZR88080.1 hypothetical protein BHM03_00015591 [Ensete ventricosum]
MGCFIGKCSGSIRSIARHPEFPMIASCGKMFYTVHSTYSTTAQNSVLFPRKKGKRIVFHVGSF